MSSSDYFQWHYKISTFFLLIPPSNLYLKVPYWIVSTTHLFLICLAPFLEFAKLYFGGSGKFSLNILNLGIAVLHFMAVTRVVKWHFIKRHYDDLVGDVRKINVDFFVFDSRICQTNPVDDYRVKKMHQTKRYCQKVFMSFVSQVTLNLLITYPLTYQNPIYEDWNNRINKTSLYRDYPYPLWYPFDTSISDGYYWLGYFYQPYAFFFVINAFFCIDCLDVNIVIHLTSHINIIGHAFTCVDKNVDPILGYQNVLKIKEKQLIKCMEELQKVYKCARKLNSIASIQLLIQTTCMTIIICCCVYRVTTVSLGPEVGYLSLVVFACATEMFTVSWFYQGFAWELSKLLNSVYDLDWVNYSPKLRKIMIFLMARIGEPFHFTIGFWKPIDMNVFLTTIRISYSFYTLLTSRSN